MQAQTDPGFKLPADKSTPDDPQPKTTPSTATGPVEVVPGALPPATDTSTRDVAIGGAIFIVLLVVYFFVRNAYVHHMVVRRVAPSTAGSAGWMLFVGLAFLSAAVVLAIVNASKYLTFGVTAPLVAVGVVALIAALVIGRR
jgi:fatty acid desaturase